MIEFAYSNSYHSSIGMTPFEALYGRKCSVCWFEVGEIDLIASKFVDEVK